MFSPTIAEGEMQTKINPWNVGTTKKEMAEFITDIVSATVTKPLTLACFVLSP